MAELASLDDLKGRLDWTLDTDEERIAQTALEDASELARFYGKASWTTEQAAPPIVRTLVLRAAKRYMDNPAGYTQSRAGDETLMWLDKDVEMGVVHFTATEIKQLERFTGKAGFGSIQVTAWGSRSRKPEGMVPVDYPGDDFPMFSSNETDW